MKYEVVKGSASGHCCFDWSVVVSDSLVKTEDYEYFGDILCECTNEESARNICDKMNGEKF